MSIQMKTYKIKAEVDILEMLISNDIQNFDNAFEIVFKNVKKKFCKFEENSSTDSVVFKVSMATLKIENNYSNSLTRGNSKDYEVVFINVKNEDGEYFSSLVENLCENDRILIIDGFLCKKSISNYNNTLCVVVRPPSSVFLFKYDRSSDNEIIPLIDKNLSKITGVGSYSLFGCITNIIKYIDQENFMLIRMKCNDELVIKTLKYPHHVNEFKNVSKEEITSGLNYDYSTKKVDILVKNPCTDFTSLKLDQRICLNNVKVKCSKDSRIFSLHVKGKAKNLKAEPVETSSVNSLRPPKKLFQIPSELRPLAKSKTKTISNNTQFASNNSFQRSNKMSPLKKSQSMSCRRKCSRITDDSSDSFSDDILNSPPFQNISRSTHNNEKTKGMKISNDVQMVSNKTLKISNEFVSPTRKASKPVQHKISRVIYLSDSSSEDVINSSPCRDFSKSRNYNDKKINNGASCSFQKQNINGASCSFQKHNINNECTTNVINSPSKIKENETRCIDSCRLIYFEPYLFDNCLNDDFLSGYCTKCFLFNLKSSLTTTKLNSETTEYRCSKCNDVVCLTFFLKMMFLYGKNESQVIQVCCYNNHAEQVIKELSKTNIRIENYLLNHNYKKLIVETMRSLICNKTKLNIVVSDLLADDTIVLLKIKKS